MVDAMRYMLNTPHVAGADIDDAKCPCASKVDQFAFATPCLGRRRTSRRRNHLLGELRHLLSPVL